MSNYISHIHVDASIWPCPAIRAHYNDVIMGAIASQITSLTIVFSSVCLDTDKKNTSKLAFVLGNSPETGEFPTQMACNAENVSI